MIALDIHKISQHLQSLGISSEIQKETGQLVAMLKIEHQEFPVFFRIFEGDELLQVLSFIPCNTKESTLNDTARLLHLLNKEIDVPGFGMDEVSHTVFYRTLIPIKDKKLDTKLLDAFINAIQMASITFAPVIAAVATGTLSFEEVLKRSIEQSKQKQHKKE